ncbi:hypothetical protein SSX86_002471 [Deinandra increscens subsp. villosa]|uniref:Uncharacterized protein n=1 Tax=Deinandra increscens subsp. villosa TaxID=3103831 RepID=A0AAP0DWH1_9ASTR
MGKGKRPQYSEPSITTATGGGSASGDPALRALAADIEKFEKNPKAVRDKDASRWDDDDELYAGDLPPSDVRDSMWADEDLLSSDEECCRTDTGGDTGDSTDRADKQRCSTDTGDANDSASADPAVLALAADIEKFEKNPKMFIQGLDLPVYSNKRYQTRWFKKLGQAWKKTPPTSPLAATRLVWDMLKEVHPNRVDVADIRGILNHYGLPQYFKVLEEDWQYSQDKEKDTSRSDDEELYAGDLPPSSWSADEELYGSDLPPSVVRDLMWDDRDLLSSDEE